MNNPQPQMRPLVLKAMDEESPYEMAKGYIRYERMRKLNLVQLAALYERNLKGESWDSMIDELILSEH